MAIAQGGQLKKTVKHSAIYAIGTMLRRLTGLVMLPIYTRYLTPEDYGVVELLTMAIEIAGILVGLRISQAMFRFYILAESKRDKDEIVATVLFTVAGSSLVGATALFFGAEFLSQIIFGDAAYIYEFQLYAFTLVTNAVIAVGLSYLRALLVQVLFVVINVISLIIQVALNIVFVVMLEMHVTGVVYSALISGVMLSVGLTFYIIVNSGIHYSKSIALRLIKFIAPLILASIGAFYVAYADKYFLRVFGSLNDVGLYALAARISAVLATAFEAFNMSWSADRFEIVKKDNAREIYEQVFRFFSAAIIFSGAGLALFANDFFHIMTSPEFYPAGNIVPLLVLAALSGIYKIYCNFGVMYSTRTGIMAEAAWINAVIASIGYLLLIPALGVYGAALTLVFSNFIEFVWVYRKSMRHYDMELKWRPVSLMLITAVLAVLLGLVIPVGEVQYFMCRVLIFIVLMIVFFKLPVWKTEEKEMMVSLLVLVAQKGRNLVFCRK